MIKKNKIQKYDSSSLAINLEKRQLYAKWKKMKNEK